MSGRPVAGADRRAAGQPQPDPLVERTILCETGRCQACPGELVSLLAPPGTRCRCPCHQAVGGTAPEVIG